MNPAACKETKSCNHALLCQSPHQSVCHQKTHPDGRGRHCTGPSFPPSLLSVSVIVPGPPEDSLTIVIRRLSTGKVTKRGSDGRTEGGRREDGWTWDTLNEPLTVATTRGHDSATRQANWSQLGTNMWILLRRPSFTLREERSLRKSAAVRFSGSSSISRLNKKRRRCGGREGGTREDRRSEWSGRARQNHAQRPLVCLLSKKKNEEPSDRDRPLCLSRWSVARSVRSRSVVLMFGPRASERRLRHRRS